MNTILHFVNIKLQYDRGVQTGFVGLVAVGLVILCVALWKDYLYPVFDRLGLVSLVEKLDLVYQGSPIMTVWHILLFGLFLLLTLWLFMILGMALLFLTFVFPYPLYAILWTLFFIFYWSPKWVSNKISNLFYYYLNPSAYKEIKRLNINKETTSLITNVGDLIDIEVAQKRLHRLPTYGDAGFLYGITFDRECYILLPHYSTYFHQFIAIPFEVKEYQEREKVIVKGSRKRNITTTMNVTKRDPWFTFPNNNIYLDMSEVEFVYECGDHPSFKNMLNNILRNENFKHYVQKTNEEYKRIMTRGKEEIAAETDPIMKRIKTDHLNRKRAWNDDIIGIMDSF